MKWTRVARLLLGLVCVGAAVMLLGWSFVMGKPVNWWAAGLLASIGALVILPGARLSLSSRSPGSMWSSQPGQLRADVEQPRLGELLVHKYKLITEEQLSQALSRQRVTRQKLGEILVQMGVVSSSQVAIALADQRTGGNPFGAEG